MWFTENKHIMALPVLDVQVSAHFHVSTAVVNMKIMFENSSKKAVDCLFSAPFKGTVTGATVRIGNMGRMLQTAVVANNELDQLEKKDMKKQSQVPLADPFDQYVPDLFRLPVTQVKSGEQVVVEMDFIEPLDFYQGLYTFNLPLSFPVGLLPANKSLAEVVRINCVVNTVVPDVQVYSSSHALAIARNEARLDVSALPPQNNPNIPVDFNLSYSLISPSIIGTLIKETHSYNENKEEQGTFALFVTPPTMESVQGFFGRNLVFLLDRSGSMSGEPWNEAKRALHSALSSLSPSDRFTIVAFDHREVHWKEDLQQASPASANDAMQWVEKNAPTGGATEIMNPMQFALGLLNRYYDPKVAVLPYVVLITDGAVANEREICRAVAGNPNASRILTFGIGSYCNWYFLKMLSQIGRGFSDACVYKEGIYEKMTRLVNRAAVPVLSNISIEMPGVESCELYPFPIPDLFVGAPLMVAGKFVASGGFPNVISLKGYLPDGQQMQINIATTVNEQIPVNKVFLKQRIDLLTSRAWLEQSKELEQEIIRISTEESMPSAYTTMVAYETTEKKLEEEKDKDKKDVKRGGMSTKTIAALAIGGVAVLGVAAFVFGDIGASMSNLPIGGDLGVGMLFDALSGCGGCIGDCCSSIGSCFGPLGGICECIGGVCGDVCGPVCGAIGDVVCSVCGSIDICSCLGSIGDCVCNVVGSCDFGAIGECLCKALSALDCK